MGRENTLPRAFGRVDAARRTPMVATGAVAVVSLLTLVENLIGSALDTQTKLIGVGALALGLIHQPRPGRQTRPKTCLNRAGFTN
jgi:amino acid transporter